MAYENWASYIDHTLLRADATQTDLVGLCAEARTAGFFSCCVNARWLPLVSQELKGSGVLPITVVGFPLGASLSEAKALETERALRAGAEEIDMVIDLGALKSGLWKEVTSDIQAVVKAASGKAVKVILETCLLSDGQIVTACRATVDAGAQFVKTSTGFSTSGATARIIRLMRQTVGPSFGVKASGGVRDYATFKELVEAGANRVGSSSSLQILKEAEEARGKQP